MSAFKHGASGGRNVGNALLTISYGLVNGPHLGVHGTTVRVPISAEDITRLPQCTEHFGCFT
jgi:hypothetical protein